MARIKTVKRTIFEMIQKNMFRRSKLIMKDGSKLRVLDWGQEEKTLDYILKLSDGSSRNFSRVQYHSWEVPKNFNVITANKERQYK